MSTKKWGICWSKETVITNVEEHKKYYSVFFNKGSFCGKLPLWKQHLRQIDAPKIGDILQVATTNTREGWIRGLRLNGSLIYFVSDEKLDEKLARVMEERKKRIEESTQNHQPVPPFFQRGGRGRE